MKRSRVLGSLAGLAAAVGLLAACATGAASSQASPAPTQSDAATPRYFGPVANWIDSGRAIALATFASEHCPVRLHDVTASGQQLTVELEVQRTDIGCTDDELHGVYVPLPDGVATDQPVKLSVTTGGKDVAELTVGPLPTAAAEVDAQHTAATMLSGHQVAVLSWGSSSCIPRVADPVRVETSQPAGLHVTFAVDDGPCTMDLAPRITVIDAAGGLDAGSRVTLENLNGSDEPVVTVVQFPAPAAP